MGALSRSARWAATGSLVAAAGYAATAAAAWRRYGRPARPSPDEADRLLDRFMPDYEVVERHHLKVAAPAELTMKAAGEIDMQASPVVRAIFRARELALGTEPVPSSRPRTLLAEVQALGWGGLAERPGREIVFGAVTRPWEPNTVFRAVPAAEFAGFAEPDYVKIVWNLRADPKPNGESVFRTETRVVTTDERARRRFRWYWAKFSPGIALIRVFMLRQLTAKVNWYRRQPPALLMEI